MLDPRVAVAAIVLVVAPVAACSDDQDPGLVPQDGTDQPSVTLGPCPPGGPDATTPPAGCLDTDGRVQRP